MLTFEEKCSETFSMASSPTHGSPDVQISSRLVTIWGMTDQQLLEAEPGGQRRCVADVSIHRSCAAAVRTEFLMDLRYLALDGGVGKLARDREQRSASLAFLVAESSVGVTLAAEDDGRATVVTLCHMLLS